MATRRKPEEEEARGSRLRVFLSSLLATIGGALGQVVELEVEEEEPEMASRAIVPQHENIGLFFKTRS